MKNFITTVASILIMFIFLMQFVANQLTYSKLLGIEMTLKNFRLSAESQEELNEGSIAALKKEISDIARCKTEEIEITINKGKEKEKIDYSVGLPITNIVGASKYLNLEEKDNMVWYSTEGVLRLKEEKSSEQDINGENR